MVYNVNMEPISKEEDTSTYNFDALKSNVPFIVNGQVVGQHPDYFDRSEIYKQNFEKMGSDSKNIKIIKNFISERECKILIQYINTFAIPKEYPVKWDEKLEPIVTRKSYVNVEPTYKYVPLVQDLLEKEYGFPVKNKNVFVGRWDVGDNLDLHVDDLGTTSTNHMATLIYLNSDYEGGEIEFPTHNISHKPQAGDLIMFPGNMHYAHEVKTITSGSRFSIPMWFEFV
jgi:hypothetical protein